MKQKTGVLITVSVMSTETANYIKEKTGLLLFDDNGEETDGNSYIIESSEIPAQIRGELNDAHKFGWDEYHETEGVIIYNYEPPSDFSKISGKWTGFSANEIAYFDSEDGADSYYELINKS